MKFGEIRIPEPERFHFRRAPLFPLNAVQQQAAREVEIQIETGRYDFEESGCFCGHPHGLLLGRYDRYGLPHFSRLCPNCGLIRTAPRMTDESYQHFYEHYFVPLHYGLHSIDETFAASRVRISDHPASGAELLSALGRLVDLRGVTDVLEVGCGAGWTLVPFRDAGFQVTGCDFDPQQVALGRRLFGLPLVRGGVEQVRAGGKTYDLVITVNVLEHVLDLPDFLNDVRNLLSAGGLLYIMTPGLTHFVSEVYPSLQYQLMVYHTYLFSEWNLEYVLRSCGFEKVFGDRFIRSLWRMSARERPLPPPVDFHMAVVNRFLAQYGDTVDPTADRGRMGPLGSLARQMYRRLRGAARRQDS